MIRDLRHTRNKREELNLMSAGHLSRVQRRQGGLASAPPPHPVDFRA